jgi:hypothetical protein
MDEYECKRVVVVMIVKRVVLMIFLVDVIVTRSGLSSINVICIQFLEIELCDMG